MEWEMILPINDRSDVEITLVLHSVFIYEIIQKDHKKIVMWGKSHFLR